MTRAVEDVLESPYISWPVKVLDTSPVSDGARAAIFVSEDKLKELDDDPVYVKGIGRGADSYWFMGRRNNDLGRLDYAYLGADQAASPVADITAARDFYTDYLGLSVEEFDLGWVARYRSPSGEASVQLVTRDATPAPWLALTRD